MGGVNPWRAWRAEVEWVLLWGDLPPGIKGVTDWEARTVTLSRRLRQRERRCTIAHEHLHVTRGPVPDDPVSVAREEVAIERLVARALIPLADLAEALAWAHSHDEAADELWVDSQTLTARLDHLHPSERAALVRRLALREDTA